MFKKAGDNVHFLDRTGSHATKGRPTGLAEHRKRRRLTSTLKMVRKRLRSLNLEISELATVTQKPVDKVKRVFASHAERKAHYCNLARDIAKAARLTK